MNEAESFEVKLTLCNLMNVIFSQNVDNQVQKLRKENCRGCKINNPSLRRHDCFMMTEQEGWMKHGLKAIQLVNEQEILWKQFKEAIRVMKMNYNHERVTHHFQSLVRDRETTLEVLKILKFESDLSGYQAILGYLSFWSDQNFKQIDILFSEQYIIPML
jgi:hypothetical protein